MNKKNKMKKFLKSLGLKKKVIFVTTFGILLLGVIITVFINVSQRHHMSDILYEKGIAISKNLAAHAEDHILIEDIVGLQRLINDVAKMGADIEYVYILDKHSAVLVHTLKNGVTESLIAANPFVDGKGHSIKLLLIDGAYISDIAVPIGEGFGIVHMGLSEDHIRKDVANTTLTLIVMTLTILVIVVMIISYLVVLMLKPMDKLAKGAKEIGTGNLDYRIEIDSTDEIGMLAGEFNNMVEHIKESRNELEKFNAQLEERVEIRTYELAESERKVSTVTNAIQDAIIMMDSQNSISYSNAAAQKMFGYSYDELIGENPFKVIVPDTYMENYFRDLQEFNDTGKNPVSNTSFEAMAQSKTGDKLPVEFSISLVKVKSELNAVGVIKDITAQKKSMEKMQNDFRNQIALASILQVSLQDIPFEEQLELTLTLLFSVPWLNVSARGSIFLVDDETKSLVLKVQRGLANEIIDKCATVPFDTCLCGKAASTGEVQFADCVTKDHTNTYDGIKPHGHYCVPIISEGRVIGVINLFLDAGHKYSDDEVTFLEAVANALSNLIKRMSTEEEREKIWGQFLQSQKMESIGRLTGGIAHDFNNLLAAIIGYADLALAEVSKEDPVWEYINVIVEAGVKSTKLVQQLLAFSRKQVLEVKLTNISCVVDSLSKMMSRVIGENIKLDFELNSTSNVMADETQLEQVLLNLSVNAKHAMPKGGSLTITTNDVVIENKVKLINQEMSQGNYVKFSVKDTGVGMVPSVLKNIFEPFFTTRAVGEGTGLGLSTVLGIIEQHNGYIDVLSKPDVGTQFDVYLPVSKEKMDTVKKETSAAPVERGHETILVVDDEDVVRRMLCDVLKSMDYQILMASSAEEALQVYEDEKDNIDIIVTDIVMPGLSGWEMYLEIKKTRPDAKIIFMSGYLENTIIIQKISDENKLFINKPVRPKMLAEKIREELEKNTSLE